MFEKIYWEIREGMHRGKSPSISGKTTFIDNFEAVSLIVLRISEGKGLLRFP
jgi:hypothetical protein